MIPAIVGVVAALAAFLAIWNQRRDRSRLPPGPKPLPIIGNILQLVDAASEFWLLAGRWHAKFGDIVYIHVFGQGIVFLNGVAAWELMERRAAIYSDRARMVMAGELCGAKDMVAFTGYGDQARRQRKLMQRALGPAAILQYHPLIEIETRSFLTQLLTTPKEYMSCVRRYAGGLTLLITYGYEVKSNADEFLALAEECVSLLSNEITGGGGIWAVDIFPFLRHIPLWMPGSGFKRKAQVWKCKMVSFVDKPYEFVKKSMANGTALSSFASTLLEDEHSKPSKLQDFDIRWVSNSLYGASIDTTITAVAQFILAMVQHPDVLRQAQQEMDAVVQNRLPTLSDRDSLPYIDAIMTEVLRWGVPVPLGLPHRLVQDDLYDGCHIPGGSFIFANIWAMSRDEKIYTNPEAFCPERFMNLDDETARRMDPSRYLFGFGRRRCPGAYLVDSSLWSLIAGMVSTLDISKALDDQGNTINPTVSYDNAIFRIPSPFECSIRPRSEHVLRLLQTDL